jgi:predicted dehydrogenase
MIDFSSPLRIGFIGAGANTRLRHLPGFQAINGVELQVVCNRSEESSRRVADAFGIRRIARHWREVVEARDVDAICIGTWPDMHAEITVAALNAGKHVLTEARMARNVGEAEAMLAAAKANSQLVAQIVPAPMSLDFDATVIDWLAKGRIGVLREVCVTHTTGLYADADTPYTWRLDIGLSGYNTLTVGIYYEIVRRWLERDPQRVLAHGAVFTPRRAREDGSVADVRIPESITILGDYVHGSRFIGHFSGVEAGSGRNEIRLNGTLGCLCADFTSGSLFFTPVGDNEVQVDIPEFSRRGWRVEKDFVDSIRTNAPVRLTGFEDGVKYMRFTEAVFQSFEKGGVWIDIF